MQAVLNLSIWQKLRRRRAAVISMYVIGIAFLLSIFAYPLVPDNSPDANRMITELGSRPPGFSKQFLIVPRKQTGPKRSWIASLFTGTPAKHNLIPINSFFFARDTLIVEHYINDGIQGKLAFSLKDLLPQNLTRQHLGTQQMQVFNRNITRHTFILGTDREGRDIFSRLLIGTRISISVGLVAVALSLSIGILLGILAGYYRGWVDSVVMYVVNMLCAIPTILLVFAIMLSLGKGFWQIFIAIGLTTWLGAARLIRRKVLAVREVAYVQAARTLGLSDMRIILRHILPNIAGPLMAIAAFNFAAAILLEAGLSFLGIGIQPPMPSWGLMMREHLLLANRPALVLIPGIAIVVLACAFNVLGNAMRDVQDERDR